MAKATATCTCERCGNQFERVKFFSKRRDADSWEAWAEKNITVCPSCYAQEKREEEEAFVSTLDLPEITGGTEKQINFASSLRRRTIARSRDRIERYRELMDNLNREILHEEAQAAGKSDEEHLRHALEQYYLLNLHIAFTSHSAREIIDLLK